MAERKNNLDLLRIISMMMVVCGHFFTHGAFAESVLAVGSANWYLANWMSALCKVSVDCFVLLSGYFQCTSVFKLKRVFSVWIQVVFWSLGLYTLTAVMGGTFSVSDALKSGMVITRKQYWFVTAYLLMYAVSPFLNCAIRAMNRKTHLLCCWVLLGIFSVAHNLVYVSDFGGVNGGASLIWFCVLYVVAAYIRLYVPVERKNRGKAFTVYGICASMIAVERFAAYKIMPLLFGEVMLESLFYSNNSIMTAAASIALLLAFRTVDVKNATVARVISFFAPLAFGVYLIHDHPAVRPLLWELLNPAGYAQSPWMVPYALVCTIGIFLVCSLAEWLRQRLFSVLRINSGIDRICDRIQGRVQNWLNAE